MEDKLSCPTTNVEMKADDCSIINLGLGLSRYYINIITVNCRPATRKQTDVLSLNFECLLKQTKHDKTSIQLQVFPNRPAIRAQMLWRNVGALFRVAMPSLVGKCACAVVLGASSPIQLLPFGSCWASQVSVSDLGLTS